ncbi:hypothetical protein ACFL2A_04770 [Thermodesulfobacteriota bacterium]
MKKSYFILIAFLLLSTQSICYGEVVNSIVARINSHTITLRDLRIECNIQEILRNETCPDLEVLEGMIDQDLLMKEILKASRKIHSEEFNERVESAVKKFEGNFADDEYDKFLSGLELKREDIHERFKRLTLINNEIEKKNKSEKSDSKKNGLNISKSMIVKEYIDISISDNVREYLKKLRKKTHLIMINNSLLAK